MTSGPADETFWLESKEAHKSRRTFLEGASISILSHEHYRLVKDTDPTPTDGNSSQSIQEAAQSLDLYELDDIEPLLTGRAIIAEGGDGPLEVHSFTYKSLSKYKSHNEYTGDSSFLSMTSCNVAPASFDAFNRWYDEKLIPSLASNSDWLGTLRGSLVLASGTDSQLPPKYTAVHRVKQPSAQTERSIEVGFDHDTRSQAFSNLVQDDVNTTHWRLHAV